MKKISKNMLKISLLVGIMVCLLGTCSVKATVVENTNVGLSTSGIMGSLSSSFFGLLEKIAPKSGNLSKQMVDFLFSNSEDEEEEEIEKETEKKVEEKETEKKAEEKDTIYGDLNGDKAVDIKDGEILSYHIIKMEEITDEKIFKNADVNLDGKVDGADYQLMCSYIDKKIDKLPVKAEVKAEEKEKIEGEADVYGDVNGDKKVDDKDVKILMLHLLEEEKIEDKQALKNADVNLDNEIDGDDFQLIYKYAMGEIKELPVEEKETEEKIEDEEEEPIEDDEEEEPIEDDEEENVSADIFANLIENMLPKAMEATQMLAETIVPIAISTTETMLPIVINLTETMLPIAIQATQSIASNLLSALL